MAAEFNIDPASSFTEFDGNIAAVIAQLAKMLPKGYTLDAVPAVRFDKDVFDSSPDVAKMLGCTPDYNAWTGGVNPPPELPNDPYLRTASGHLHIGWTEGISLSEIQHVMNCRDLVKQFDWFLGAWSLSKDPDPTRRLLYGKAGACRYKDYGVEYRVLSNFWVMSKSTRLEVWNRMQSAIQAMKNSTVSERVPEQFNTQLRDGINASTLTDNFKQTFRYPLQTLEAGYANF